MQHDIRTRQERSAVAPITARRPGCSVLSHWPAAPLEEEAAVRGKGKNGRGVTW